MAIDPAFTPDLDIATIVPVVDMAPAVIDYLRTIRARQHAQMSGWGGPPVCRSTHLATSLDMAWTFTISVPPGVTEMDFSLLVYGTGIITITSPSDAIGTQLIAAAPTDGGVVDPDVVSRLSTGGALSASAGAASGRAVIVRSALSWERVDVDLTIDVSDVVDTLGIRAITFAPVHRSR